MDAIGNAVTGGMLARAVEPNAGEAADAGHTHEKSCLNCGTPLAGPYCSACGQKAHVHRSLRGFAQDFFQALFNFEGKMWRTLPMLVLHPGEMTRRYIAGERARFISPVALYLFTVFAMFAALNLTGELSPSSTGAHIQNGLKESIKEDEAALIKLEAKRQLTVAAHQDVSDIDRKIEKRKEDIADAQTALKTGKAFVAGNVDDTPGWIRPFIDNARDNPALVTSQVQDAATKYSWLLILFSVPFLWLLFPFSRRYNTYDHMVFVTYSLSFMMLLVVGWSVLVAVGLTTLGNLLFFVPPFHMYRHLKEAYRLGRFSAIMRTMALVGFAFAAAAIFMVTAVAIGAS